MKKLVMETKVALGVAPKTEDKEYDRMAGNLKDAEKVASDYRSAMERMRSASQSLNAAMEAMSKVFNEMSARDNATEAMKSVASDYQEVVKKVNDRFLVDLKRAIDDNESMTKVKDLASECRKLESKRSTVMAEYDAYRDAVSKKEAEYKKKSKDLSSSKHYQDEVTKRDSSKEDFEKADKEFKDKYAELEKEETATYTAGISAYLSGTSQFVDALEKELAPITRKANEPSK